MPSPEIAVAYVSVVPSMRDFGTTLTQGITGPAATAGGQAGDAAGGAMSGRLGGALKAGLAGAAVAAGAVLVKGLTDAIDQGAITRRMQAQMGATTKDAERYGDIAGRLYSQGVTENFQQGADTIRAISSAGLVPPDATNAQLESIATKMADVANVFGTDLTLQTQAVSALLTNGLAPSAEVALDTITAGMQRIGPQADDVLETLQEYPVQLRKLGLDAQASMGLFAQGMQAGARDTDIIADALKEFSIRAIDMSDTSRAAYEAIGLSAEEMEAKIGAGGESAREGLDQVLDGLRAMSDPVAREAAAVGLFGTQAEDMGAALLALDPSNAVETLGDVGGAAEGLGEVMRSGPMHEIEVFRRTVQQNLVDFMGGTVLPALGDASHFLSAEFAPVLRDAADWASAMWDAVDGDARVGEVVAATRGLAEQMGSQAADAAGATGDALGSVGNTVRTRLLPPLTDVGAALRDDVAPALGALQSAVSRGLGPVLSGVADLMTDRVVPAVVAVYAASAEQLAPILRAVARVATEDIGPAIVRLGRSLGDLLRAVAPVVGALVAVVGGVLMLGAAIGGVVIPVVLSLAGALLSGLVTAVTWVVDGVTLLVTGLTLLGQGLLAVGQGAIWLWREAIQPSISPAIDLLQNLATFFIVVVAGPVIAVVAALGAIIQWLWREAVQPAISAAGAVFVWLWETAVEPSLSAIGDAAGWLYRTALSPAFDGIGSVLSTTGDAFTWLWETAAEPALRGIGDVAEWVWDHALHPAFDAMERGVEAVGNAFGDAKDFISDQWNSLRNITKGPVEFIINTVYNGGIVPLWNSVARVVGADRLSELNLSGWATGGVLPGYTPGRDVHLAALSGGEAVMRPEWTRAVGSDYIYAMNAIAATRGIGGVRDAMSASGGSLPGYAGGGIVDTVGGWISNAVDWGRQTAAGWIGGGFDLLLENTLGRIPGRDSMWRDALIEMPGRWVDALLGVVEGAEASMGGSGTWQAPVRAMTGATYGQAGPMWASGYHTGLDYLAPYGAAVGSVMAGTVNRALNGGPYGNHVYINHPGGLRSLYAHLSDIAVAPGQSVDAGDIIGHVGSTGNSSGPHLHLEAFQHGARINPASLFDDGGWLQPGQQIARNDTGRPEPVLTAAQWRNVATLAERGDAPGAGRFHSGKRAGRGSAL